MKIKILEPNGSFVPGIADVSEEVAARAVKSGLAEYLTKEEKVDSDALDVSGAQTETDPPVISPEGSKTEENDQTNAEGAKAPEAQTEIKE